MDKFYTKIQDWMNSKMTTTPSSLCRGWLISRYDNFELYDIQSSLASGTYSSIGVSMAAAFVVMLVMSLNVIITFYSIVTIFMTISVCAGNLVLLGWELNIVESVTLTMSVGLSIDFCIHYGMGYRLSTLVNRKLRVQESFRKVATSIFMAAATTFIAGVCIMPAIILFYVQLGTFLMIVMTIRWLFATFFFQSLCYVIGPNGDFCQIPSPCLLFRKRSNDQSGGSGGKVSPSHNEVDLSNNRENWFLFNGKLSPEINEGNGDIERTSTTDINKKFEDPFSELPNGTPRCNQDGVGVLNSPFDGSQASLEKEDKVLASNETKE